MISQSINVQFVGTSSIKSFSRPNQQITLLDAANPSFLRQVFFSNDGLRFVSLANNYSILIPLSALYTCAISASTSMSWAPFVTDQPTAQTVTAGEPADFKITASSESSMSFQWQFLSQSATYYQSISGALQFTTSVVDAAPDYASVLHMTSSTSYGDYTFRCIMANSSGYTTSSAVLLTET